MLLKYTVLIPYYLTGMQVTFDRTWKDSFV